jgi:hypothetical protein
MAVQRDPERGALDEAAVARRTARGAWTSVVERQVAEPAG